MSKKIDTSQLNKELMDYLDNYVEDISEGVKKTTDSITKEVVNELKNKSPKLTGDYAKGWTKQTNRQNKSQKYTVKVHNKTNYQLTHLLEFGHIKRNGTGRVPAREHIRPIEDEYKKKYEQEITTVIRRGSKK